MLFAILGLLALAFSPAALLAQTGDRGALTVEVRNESGELMQGVRVVLATAERSTPVLERTTSTSGLLRLRFLSPGSYVLDVERLGFIPVRVRNVRVLPGERQQLELTLRSGEPPITERDAVDFADLVLQRTPAGSELFRNRADLLVLESRNPRQIPDFATTAAEAGPLLPSRFLGIGLDGMSRPSAYAPAMGPGRDRFYSTPSSLVDLTWLGLSRHPADRIPGVGPVLGLRTWTGEGTDASGRIAAGMDVQTPGLPDEGTHASPWMEAVMSTGLRGDTMRASFGIDVRSLSEGLPTLLGPTSNAPSTLTELRAVFSGSELPSGPVVRQQRTLASGYSRLDWELGESTWWTLMAGASVLAESDGIELPPIPEGLGSATSGADIVAHSRLLSATEEGHAVELDLSVQRSSRNTLSAGASDPDRFRGGLVDEGISIAPIRDAAGEFALTRVALAPSGTYAGEHLGLRGGMTLSFDRWSDVRPEHPGTHRLFAGLGGLGSNAALTHRSEGAGRDLALAHQRFSLFGEARWTPSRDFGLTLGTRIDWERFPFEELPLDNAWEQATGLVDATPEGALVRVSPSAELRWEPSTIPGWGLIIRGGLHPGGTEPGFIGNLVHSRDDTDSVWSLGTDGTSMEYRGRRLTLLGPEFQSPRTESVSLRVDGTLHRTLRLGLEVFSHETDFLPRRRDLNRTPGQGLVDQFARSHWGEITTSAGLAVVRPGSDRRFPGFDRVWALEADGWSTTRGVALGLTFEHSGLIVESNYRRTESRDNAPFGPTGAPIPLDGAWGNDLSQADWVEGRSDRDRPHAFSILGSLGPSSTILKQIALSYHGASGLPFTPGVRDALGHSWETGWTQLEPITLPADAELPAAGEGWSCDAPVRAGDTRKRNQCRGEAVHHLNARLVIGLRTGSLQNVDLRLEALNLLDHGEVVRDPALFVADGDRNPSIDSASGALHVPVRENPNFGRPIMKISDGRSFRVSLEYRFR